ncbi:MAG: DNA-directed RNA polymerase subunit L [Candidatus Diapherotrites archaeon]|nr:DNA-directed RNA polymerase subunit L [Candidatus Diapherotrites archaeon]
MKVEFLKKQKNFVEFKILGERHTFSSILKQELLNDESVEFAAYKLEHPMDQDCVFVVRTKDKSALKALEDAGKRLQSELKDLKGAMGKAMK